LKKDIDSPCVELLGFLKNNEMFFVTDNYQ